MAAVPLVTSRPGMTTWVCGTCANPNVVLKAKARILSPDGGEVGNLALLQSLPRDEQSGVSGPVMIDVSHITLQLAAATGSDISPGSEYLGFTKRFVRRWITASVWRE